MPRLRLRSRGARLDPARAARGGEPADPPVRGARLRLGHGRLRARRRRATRAACASPRRPSSDADFLERHRRSAGGSSTCTCAAPRWAGCRSRTRIRSASAATRSATTARSCATRGCSSTRASRSPPGDTDSEAFFNFLMRDYDAGDPIGVAAPRDPHDGRALALLGPQLPLLGRRAPVRLPAGHLRAALAAPARPAAGGLRARDRRAVAHRPAGRAARARPGRPRGAARRAPGRRRAGRAARRSRRSSTSAHLRGEARGAVAAERAPGGSGGRREPPLRAAREPGLGRGQGARRRSRPCTTSSTASGAAHRTVDHAQHRARRRGGARAPPSRARRWRRSAATACCARSRSALKGRDAALAIIPCGRGNDLARVLGHPDATRARPPEVAVDGPASG